MKRSCKEAKKAIEQVERTNRFSRLYSSFKVVPPPKPKNFFLVMDEDNMNNWDEPRDQSQPRSRSRSKNTRNKNNFNHLVNPSNTSNNSYANALKNKNNNVNNGPPPIPPRPNLKNNKNRPHPQKKDVTILPTSISVNDFNDTVKRINALEELFTQLTTQVGLLAQRMTEIETKFRTEVPQYIPSLNTERDIFNEHNKRVRSSSYTPSNKDSTWNTDFGSTSPSFSSSSMDTTPISGPLLASSPSSSSPTISSEEQLNDRLSSLEQVASTAMNALNMFTSRFSYDQRTGRQLSDTESGQQQLNSTSSNEQ
jgi:hypothetical protein